MSSQTDTENGEICLLNELDGFSIRPRLSIPFNGEIHTDTATSQNIFLLSLGDAMVEGHPPDYKLMAEADDDDVQLPLGAGLVIGIDQAVWDPDTHTLYAQTNAFLDQHTRYALIVTRGVLDANKQPIGQADAFNRLRGPNDDGSNPEVKAYSQALRLALAVLEQKGVHRNDIAVASVFSTLSSTAVLEKVRSNVMSLPAPKPAQFDIGPNIVDPTTNLPTNQQSLAVFDLATLHTRDAKGTLLKDSFDFNRQTKDPPASLSTLDQTSRLDLLRMPELGQTSISKVAFGRYISPNYLDQNGLMSAVATFSGTPALQSCDSCTNSDGDTTADKTHNAYHYVYFNVFVPAGTPPPGGWPVVLYGNGSADNMTAGPFNVAEDFASHGFATVGFNLVGQGFGPNSSITFAVYDNSDYCTSIGIATTPCRATIGLPGRSGVNPKNETVRKGTLCRKGNCEWEQRDGILNIFDRWQWSE